MDNNPRFQTSDKWKARRYGPFKLATKVGKNGLKLDLPTRIKIYPVVSVSMTVPYYAQQEDIGVVLAGTPQPVATHNGTAYEVEEIMDRRKRGHAYQF